MRKSNRGEYVSEGGIFIPVEARRKWLHSYYYGGDTKMVVQDAVVIAATGVLRDYYSYLDEVFVNAISGYQMNRFDFDFIPDGWEARIYSAKGGDAKMVIDEVPLKTYV